jgi:hypothetical protein
MNGNVNGLYGGLEGYIVAGTNSGMGNGMANGLVNDERKQIDKLNILDKYPLAAAAYSLRKLSRRYSGPAIRVRRSSDNLERDIFFDSNGNLNESNLTSFVGAGNNGFVSIWYDQSGSNRIAIQTTLGAQPQIITSGVIERDGSNPSIRFNGSTFLATVGVGPANTTGSLMSYFSVIGFHPGNASAEADFFGTREGINSGWGYVRRPGSYSLANYGGVSAPISSALLARHISSGFRPSSSVSILFINSTIQSGSGGGNVGSNSYLAIGTSGVNVRSPLIGNLQELIIYESDLSPIRTFIESDINSYYKIY